MLLKTAGASIFSDLHLVQDFCRVHVCSIVGVLTLVWTSCCCNTLLLGLVNVWQKSLGGTFVCLTLLIYTGAGDVPEQHLIHNFS